MEIRAHPDGVGIQYRLIPERGARIDITDSVIPIRWCLPLPTGQTSPIRAILDQLYLGAAATRFAATRVTDPPNVNWVLSPNISGENPVYRAESTAVGGTGKEHQRGVILAERR